MLVMEHNEIMQEQLELLMTLSASLVFLFFFRNYSLHQRLLPGETSSLGDKRGNLWLWLFIGFWLYNGKFRTYESFLRTCQLNFDST